MRKSDEFLQLAKQLNKMSEKDFLEITKKYPKNIKTLIRARCYYNLKAFAQTFFRKEYNGKIEGHAKDPFNKMHLEFFKNFHPEEKNIKKCILASRGSAKTTLICLIYALHKICYGNDTFIAIFSSVTPLAIKKSEDIHREVDDNEMLKMIFGLKFVGSRKPGTQSFTLTSRYGQCMVRSQGVDSEIRGIKVGSSRISTALFDDVVHSEEVFSEEQRLKLERKFKTDILPAAQPGTNFIYIGTRIHDEDLGSILSRDPNWDSYLYPAFEKWPTNMHLWEKWEDIKTDPTVSKKERDESAASFYNKNKKDMLKGSKVLWPEREPPLELMLQRLLLGVREFGAEKQMEAFLTADSLFQSICYFYPTEKDEEHYFYIPKYEKYIRYDESRFHKYYALDPGTGERKRTTATKSLSNSARIVAAYDTHTGNLYILDCFLDRAPQSKIIEEMCELQSHHDFTRMFVEENLYRDQYNEHISYVVQEWNRKFNLNVKLPISSIWNSVDKEHRIYALEPFFTRNKIIVNQHINPKYLSELTTYPNSDKNDALDATEILWQGIHSKGFRSIQL